MEARGLWCESCCDVPATRCWDEGLNTVILLGRHRYTPLCDRCWDKRDAEEHAAQVRQLQERIGVLGTEPVGVL